MKLLPLLREHLLSSIGYLRQSPDKLLMAIDEGRLKYSANSLSHRQEYKLLIEIDEWPASLDADILFIALIQWMQQYQGAPGINEYPINFQTYVTSNSTTTVAITVDLSEKVMVNDEGQVLAHCEVSSDQ